jgi:ubiquitin
MGQEPESTPQAGPEPTPATESNEPQAGGKTFDEGYVKQLRAEAAQHRREAQEAKQRAQELEERDQSEVEKLTTKATKAERERDEAKAALLRYEVAAEKQVPPEAVDLLVGNTREELEAKADRLLELTKGPDPDFDAGAREPAPEVQNPEDAHDDLALAILGLKPNQ